MDLQEKTVEPMNFPNRFSRQTFIGFDKDDIR